MDVPPGQQSQPHDHKDMYSERLKVSSQAGVLSRSPIVRRVTSFLSNTLTTQAQLLLEMTRHQQREPHELDVQSGAVYANTSLPAGTRFGPYQLNYTAEPADKALAWEVSSWFCMLCAELNNSIKSTTWYRQHNCALDLTSENSQSNFTHVDLRSNVQL